MKAFRFRLESLLHLRGLTREKCLKDYAEAISQRQSQEDRCEQISRRLNNIETSVATQRDQGISGHDQDTFLASIEHARNALTKQREVVVRSLAEEEKKKAIYLKADMAEKILLRLKERRKKEHIRVQEAKDERALEDVIGARYGILLPTELSYESS